MNDGRRPCAGGQAIGDLRGNVEEFAGRTGLPVSRRASDSPSMSSLTMYCWPASMPMSYTPIMLGC